MICLKRQRYGYSPPDFMIAERMQYIKDSATVRLSSIVTQMRKEGKDVISLSLGEPDFDTPSNIRNACAEAINSGMTHYTPAPGIMELREAIAEKSREENGIPCEVRNVMVTPSKFGIYAGIMAVVNPGDEVIIPDPCWVSYPEMIKLAGGKPVFVRHRKDWRWSAEDIGNAVTEKTRMIVVNSPSNPTGAVHSEEELRGIAEIALDNDVIVLTDEIYEKIIYDGKHYSIASFPGMFDRTITVNGFSKAYAMTGWRMGWVIAPDQIFKEILKIQEHALTCVTSFAQKAGIEAIKGNQDSLSQMVEKFRRRRELITKLINEISGFRCEKPKGAFYIFPEYDYDVPSEHLAELLLKEAGVAVTPGSAFGPSGEGHIRISYAASDRNIEEGIRRIKDCVERWVQG